MENVEYKGIQTHFKLTPIHVKPFPKIRNVNKCIYRLQGQSKIRVK